MSGPAAIAARRSCESRGASGAGATIRRGRRHLLYARSVGLGGAIFLFEFGRTGITGRFSITGAQASINRGGDAQTQGGAAMRTCIAGQEKVWTPAPS